MNERLEKHGYALFKVIRERLLVQEHPGILVLSVKLVLQLPYAPYCAVCITIPRQHQNSGVRPTWLSYIVLWGHVILVGDFL